VSWFYKICFALDDSHIRSGIYFRKLLGRTDIEEALKRLDNLIQEEVRMATAHIMKATIEHKDGAQPLRPHPLHAEPLYAQTPRKPTWLSRTK
jgi:hypothetical protein